MTEANLQTLWPSYTSITNNRTVLHSSAKSVHNSREKNRYTSCERERRIYTPVLHSGPYRAKNQSQAAPGDKIPSYLVVIVEATHFHLHHYPSKAGRGGTTS